MSTDPEEDVVGALSPSRTTSSSCAFVIHYAASVRGVQLNALACVGNPLNVACGFWFTSQNQLSASWSRILGPWKRSESPQTEAGTQVAAACSACLRRHRSTSLNTKVSKLASPVSKWFASPVVTESVHKTRWKSFRSSRAIRYYSRRKEKIVVIKTNRSLL